MVRARPKRRMASQPHPVVMPSVGTAVSATMGSVDAGNRLLFLIAGWMDSLIGFGIEAGGLKCAVRRRLGYVTRSPISPTFWDRGTGWWTFVVGSPDLGPWSAQQW